MRIALASDAWAPQTNGVVTTLKATADTLAQQGHEVHVISPRGLRSIACPSYPEIRLAVLPGAHVARQLRSFRPHAIHVATEGPVGLAVRGYCRARGVPFTTSYHTRYPEYLRARWPIPLTATYAWLRRFHGAAARTFISSASLERQLTQRGFQHLHLWPTGHARASRRRTTPASLLRFHGQRSCRTWFDGARRVPGREGAESAAAKCRVRSR